MSARPDLLERLVAARPADPSAPAAEQAAVRVLARVVVLEAGRRAARTMRAPRRRLRPALVVAAVLALACVPTALSRRDARAPLTGEGAGVAAPASPSAWSAGVRAALDGDAVQRQRVVHGGSGARDALLAVAERRGSDAAKALALLGRTGALRDERDTARVARLVRDPRLRAAAADLLAHDLGPAGARLLAARLVDTPEAEAVLVEALEAMAARGRRDAALHALLAGTAAGRRLAAASAVRVAGASALVRVLAVLPADLVGDRDVVAALRAGPATVRARLVRLAARGDRRALALGARARARGIVTPLAAEALHEDPARAAVAVDLLAALGDTAAYLALARALDGHAAERARDHLASAGHGVREALARRARASVADSAAAMRALAGSGPEGLAALAALAGQSRLAPQALRVLGAARAPEAATVLASLAGRRALLDDVLVALAARLSRGDALAANALLHLARQGHARGVVRELREAGEAGRPVLQRALLEPRLAAPAREALLRLDARKRPAASPGRRLASRPDARSRSI